MTMGEKILNMRKARGWSQEELAERIGVTRQAVSRWESGSAKPDADKIIAICNLFEMSADYLLLDKTSADESKAPSGLLSKLTRDQKIGWFLILLGVIVLVILTVLSCIYPVDYTVVHADKTESHYSGLGAFVLGNGLLWIVVLIGIAILVGVIFLVDEKLKR